MRYKQLWRQRCKQLWLQAGDRNTKFFHAMATERKRSNTISQLKDYQGNWISWEQGLDNMVVEYLTDLFTSVGSNYSEITNYVDPCVSASQNACLLRPIELEEVRGALFQMHPDKAPGPDGMSPGFFQKFWHIVQQDVFHLVLSFFSTGSFPVDLNHKNIVLIPKKKQPQVLGD